MSFRISSPPFVSFSTSRVASRTALGLAATCAALACGGGSDDDSSESGVQPFNGAMPGTGQPGTEGQSENGGQLPGAGSNSDGQATQPGASSGNSEALPGSMTFDSTAMEAGTGQAPVDTTLGGEARGQGPAITGDSEELLALATRFYGAQRSGDGANWLLNGQSCHTNDGESIGADLSGGWYDAGDHVKVTLSIAYAAYLMLKGYDAYPQAFSDNYGARYEQGGNGVPDVLDEARFATDYLVKAHISEDVLVGMVGDTTADHSTWSTCVDQEGQPVGQGGRPRRVSTEANADIAGLTA